MFRVCDELIEVQVQDVQGHPESTSTRGHWPASRWIRLLLTLVGAAGMVAAAFRNWIQSLDALGVELNVKMLWDPDASPTFLTGGGFDSVGFVALALGVIAIMGLWPRIWWVTVVAGALGVAEATLFVVTAYRADGYRDPPGTMTLSYVEVGVWLLVAGGVLLLVAGFIGIGRSRAPAPEVESPLLRSLSEPSEQDPPRP
jgi:hypothetical protein